MLTAQKMQVLCLTVQRVRCGHQKVPDLRGQVALGIAQGPYLARLPARLQQQPDPHPWECPVTPATQDTTAYLYY